MDLEEALAGPVVLPHAGCAAGRALADMDDDDAEKVKAALKIRTASHVAGVVKEYLGFDVNKQTWNRHRRGDCACDKVGLA